MLVWYKDLTNRLTEYKVALGCPNFVYHVHKSNLNLLLFVCFCYSSLASTANTPYSSLFPLRSSCVFRLVEAPLGAPHIDSHHGHTLTSTRSCSWSEEQSVPSRPRSPLSPFHHCCLHSLLVPLLLTSIDNTKLFSIAFLLFRFWFERIELKEKCYDFFF